MNPAWRKTQKGRIVYPSAGKAFTSRDAARVLRSVLAFDTRYDDDYQMHRLFYFLYSQGFIGLNVPVWREALESSEPAWFVELKEAVYGLADAIGVPEIAQTFALEMGNLIDNIVRPPLGHRYLVSDGFARIMYEERELAKREGRGVEWLLRPD